MPLPAPYAPPWKRLWEDGVAMAAWARLKVQEVWRRNWEGTLPVPGGWPRSWPQLFWPLALAALLLTTLMLVRAWPRSEAQGPVERDGPSPAATARAAPQAPKPSAPPSQSPFEEEPPSEERKDQLRELSDSPAQEEDTEDQPDDTTTFSSEPLEEEVAEPPVPDPLLSEWSEADPEHLIEAITPEPASATLTLVLSGRFADLPAGDRQRWAERWQARAADEGYPHLELRDGEDRELGREALVGSGMILLQPIP